MLATVTISTYRIRELLHVMIFCSILQAINPQKQPSFSFLPSLTTGQAADNTLYHTKGLRNLTVARSPASSFLKCAHQDPDVKILIKITR
jgi:hypothetical protein